MTDFPAFVLFLLQFDNKREDYDGEFSAEAISKFVGAASMPLVIEFSDKVRFKFHFQNSS